MPKPAFIIPTLLQQVVREAHEGREEPRRPVARIRKHDFRRPRMWRTVPATGLKEEL